MNNNMTNIHAHCNLFFSVIGKCCIVETNLESLIEIYKGPGYCISRYHGNADVCFNIRNLI